MYFSLVGIPMGIQNFSSIGHFIVQDVFFKLIMHSIEERVDIIFYIIYNCIDFSINTFFTKTRYFVSHPIKHI